MTADNSSDKSSRSPLRQQLDEMINGYRITQLIYVAAKLGIADLILGGARITPNMPSDITRKTEITYHELHN